MGVDGSGPGAGLIQITLAERSRQSRLVAASDVEDQNLLAFMDAALIDLDRGVAEDAEGGQNQT
jgi:hypothetical protein